MTAPDIIIDNIGGNCPIQAEGTINGVEFYFRARGRHWALHVGPDPLGDDAWVYRAKYTAPDSSSALDERYAAGWMSQDEARGFIADAAKLYVARAG